MRVKSYQAKKSSWVIGAIALVIIIGMAYIIGMAEIKTITCVNQIGETIEWDSMVKDTSLANLPAKLITVNRKEIESMINNQQNYQLDIIHFQFPNTLLIHVIEYEPSAYLIFNDQQLVLDQYGVVINTHLLDEPLDNLPLVKGVRINGYMIGETINTIEPQQLETLKALILAVNEITYPLDVKIIDVSNPVNAFIETKDETLVRIGRIEHVEEKMKWLASKDVREYCLTQSTGYLDLSMVSEPIYRLEEEEKLK